MAARLGDATDGRAAISGSIRHWHGCTNLEKRGGPFRFAMFVHPALLLMGIVERKNDVMVTLTNRDVDVLETLTLKVHLATLEQIFSGWWSNCSRGTKAARERLSKLEKDGWIERHRVNVHPMLTLAKPELTWVPGGPTPDFGPVSYRLKKRWTEA